nr:Mariner Mos1 transposase [Hymenolepis microstoma]
MENWRRAILSEDSCQTEEELSESLGGYQGASNFKTLETVGNESDRKIMGTPRVILQVETMRCGTKRDNAKPLYVANLVVKKYLETLKREILPHPPPYSPDVAPSAHFRLIHLAQWHTPGSPALQLV